MRKKYINMPSGYTVEVLTNMEQIEKYKSFWEEKLLHPDGNIDIYLKDIYLNHSVKCPYALIVFFNNNPEAMFIGTIQEKCININLSYKILYGPKLRILTIFKEKVFGNISLINSQLFIYKLISLLENREIDLIQLKNVIVESHIFKIAKKLPLLSFRDYYPETILHWETKLPAVIDELFLNMGSKQKHEIFRKERRIEREFHNNISYICYKNEEDIEALCMEVENIASNSFQRKLGYGFIYNTENKDYLTILAKRGWLRGYLIYINKKPCAFYICVNFSETFYFRFSGHDLSYKKYSPGIVLLKYILEDIYKNEKNIKVIDWGQGDQIFKKHLSNYSYKEGSIFIFPPTFYGFFLNCTKSFLVFIKSITTELLIKIGQKDKISSIYRQQLLKKYLLL
jgi:hypothetical protein